MAMRTPLVLEPWLWNSGVCLRFGSARERRGEKGKPEERSAGMAEGRANGFDYRKKGNQDTLIML